MAAQSHEHSLDGAGRQFLRRGGPFRRTLRRAWPVLRFVLGLGIIAVAVWALSSHRDELSGLSDVFGNLKWWWIPPAVIVEMASFVCFAGMENEFLRSGGLAVPEGPLVK